jgi:small-conductance mechanosensitive channel
VHPCIEPRQFRDALPRRGRRLGLTLLIPLVVGLGLAAVGNAMIIRPSQKLAQSAIPTSHLPETRISLLFPIGVAYGSDPDVVERVLVEEATRAAKGSR